MFLISSISQGPKAEACPRGSVLFFVIDVINDSILLFFSFSARILYVFTSIRVCGIMFLFFTSPQWQKFLLIALNWPIKNTVTDIFFFVTASSRAPKQNLESY